MRKIWNSKPISLTCEVSQGASHVRCGCPATHAYKAMFGGWMALCKQHAEIHLDYALPITDPQCKASGFQTGSE